MFYKPKDAFLGDVIPYFHNGTYYLYYLNDYRGKDGKIGVSWNLITTKDFVNFTDHGVMIEAGEKDEQDLFAFTGSIIEKDNKFYCFYTGHNPNFFPSETKPQQAVLLATSDDLLHWKKQDFYLRSPSFLEPHDFRDPFVFYEPESKTYKMLLAARNTYGSYRRRGVTAIATSKDLLTWEVEKNHFYDPHNFYTHECPDLFKIGDYWYLVFSEFSDRVATRYRISKSWNGPWITPVNDVFDSKLFYAAKTVGDGKRRFAFGWNPTSENFKDNRLWQWGGTLTVHEIYQKDNGELGSKIPHEVLETFFNKKEITYSNIVGDMNNKEGRLFLGNDSGYSHVVLGETNCTSLTSFDLNIKDKKGEFGFFFYSDDLVDNTYFIRFEPKFNRVVFDKWPREANEKHCWIETERYVNYKENNNIKIYIDHSAVIVYINDEIALSGRFYDYTKGKCGLYASDTKIEFSNLEVKTND